MPFVTGRLPWFWWVTALAEAHVEEAVCPLLDVNRPLHPILGQLDAVLLQRLSHAGRDRGIELQGHLRRGRSRMHKADDTPEPRQAARNEGQEPATAAAAPPPSAPATPSQPPSDPARSEAPITQEPKATAATFDGTWSVSLTGGGFLCSRVPSQTLTVQNGSVRGGSGVSVSGQVEPSGSISLALQKSGIRGSASGTLSGASGSGSWTAPSST